MDTPAPQPPPASSAAGLGAPPPPPPEQVPEVRAPTRWERMRAPVLTAAGIGALTIALHFRDPHTSGSWGLCPFKLLTGGMDCPGCGGLRAVNDLTNGDVSAAASSNLLFVLMVPVLVVWWLRWAVRSWTGAPAPERAAGRARVLAVGLGVVAVVFWVVRNTPWGSWLHS